MARLTEEEKLDKVFNARKKVAFLNYATKTDVASCLGFNQKAGTKEFNKILEETVEDGFEPIADGRLISADRLFKKFGWNKKDYL